MMPGCQITKARTDTGMCCLVSHLIDKCLYFIADEILQSKLPGLRNNISLEVMQQVWTYNSISYIENIYGLIHVKAGGFCS